MGHCTLNVAFMRYRSDKFYMDEANSCSVFDC